MNKNIKIKISKRGLVTFIKTSSCSLLYCMALVYLLSSAVLKDWERFGISYDPYGIVNIPLFFIIIPFWAAALPARIDRPSSLFLCATYFFICIPTLVAACFLEGSEYLPHASLLFALVIGFFMSCLISNAMHAAPMATWRVKSTWAWGMIILWCLLLLFLIKEFSSVMSIVSLDDIYAQRELGQASSLIYGYVQTYFGYVFSIAILALGFFKKKGVFVIIGYIGALALYAITAEKSAIVYPFIVTALFFVLRRKNGHSVLLSIWFIAAILAVFIFLGTYFYHEFSLARFFVTYVGARSILTPGVLTIHYFNYFSEYGFTYFSHIRGIDAIIDAPHVLSSDSWWPLLGHMIGENYFGIPTLNANAHFLAWDGVASMGSIGVLVAFAMFSMFLVMLSFATKGIDNKFSIPAIAPAALILTNGSLFSLLLSFGGFFFLLFFLYGFKRTGKGAL